jgi:hypothetical protein
MHVGYATAASYSVSSPSGRVSQLSVHANAYTSPTRQTGGDLSVTAATRLTSALRLDLVPSVKIVEDRRQYLDTIVDAAAVDTYGARYLFGHLHRKELALQLRATLSLSPDLVITVFAQPFVSVGKYDQIGELTRAGGADVRWYATAVHDTSARTIVDGATVFSISEPDYSVASLRSTAVLRWEFRPGSTLFIAWQQDRGGVPLDIAHTLHNSLSDAFTQSAVHTLAVKLSYWFD